MVLNCGPPPPRCAPTPAGSAAPPSRRGAPGHTRRPPRLPRPLPTSVAWAARARTRTAAEGRSLPGFGFPTRPRLREGARPAGTGSRRATTRELGTRRAAKPRTCSDRGRRGRGQETPDLRVRLTPVETAPLPQGHRACATSHFRDCPEGVGNDVPPGSRRAHMRKSSTEVKGKS